MQLKDNSRYIAMPAKVFMTIVVILTAVLILQAIAIEMAHLLPRPERESRTTQPGKELTDEEKRLQRIQYSAKECLPDGTIHLVYHRGRRLYGQWEGSDAEQIYDTNDNLLWEGLAEDRPYKYLSWGEYTYGPSFRAEYMRQMQMITPELSRILEIPVLSQNKKTIEIWRYVPWRDCFVGYKAGGERIGYAGATGFVESVSDVRPFGKFRAFLACCPENSFSPTLLWETSRSVYEISFEKRKVESVFESPDVDIDSVFVHMWGFLSHRDVVPVEGYREGYRPLIRCRTEDGKDHLVMRDPAQRLTVETPEEWGLWKNSHSRFTATTQAVFMKHQWIETDAPKDFPTRQEREKWWHDYRTKPKKHWVEFYKVDAQANLKSLNRYGWTAPGEAVPGKWPGAPWQKAQRYVSRLSPPLYDLSWHLIRHRMMPLQSQNEVTREVLAAVDEFRPGLSVWNWILGALMVGFAAWHGRPRRKSWGWLAFWLVFVWLFNLAGLLTYLALNHTPVIECPACGKRRGLSQARCVRCKGELPAPKRGPHDLIFEAQASPAT